MSTTRISGTDSGMTRPSFTMTVNRAPSVVRCGSVEGLQQSGCESDRPRKADIRLTPDRSARLLKRSGRQPLRAVAVHRDLWRPDPRVACRTHTDPAICAPIGSYTNGLDAGSRPPLGVDDLQTDALVALALTLGLRHADATDLAR